MLTKSPKQKAMLILASLAKPKGKESGKSIMDEDEESNEEGGEGQLAAAEELIQAINDGDAKEVLAAFKSLMELC
jgi:hypothetical protein